MNCNCQLSNVTKNYLSQFECILAKMEQGMTEAVLTDSISHNFIVQMIPHHQAAIDMSESILRYTTNIPLQNIALGIIEEQEKSIRNMESIKCECNMEDNCGEDLREYQYRMDRIIETMFSEMSSACADNNVSADFMREMIPHHMGAIRMSKLTLQYEICPELIPILKAIIRSQERGVMQMRRLLRC